MGLFKRRAEKREASFTDSVTAALFAQAVGSAVGDPAGLGVLEAAAGLYARCFAGADISSNAVGPSVAAMIARDLIRRGESLHLIEVRAGAVQLVPVGSWDIAGISPSPSTWVYRCDTFGPSGNTTRIVPASGVVHCRYAFEPSRPWAGISPLGWAIATGTLAANLERVLGQESGGVVAHVLPVPQDGGDGSADDPLRALKRDVARAKGSTVLTETTADAFGEGSAAAPRSDWVPRRIGANPPAALGVLRGDASSMVLAACGIPPSLFRDLADGTAQREAFRRFLTTACEPLAALIAEELAAKLEESVSFGFENLYAHDLAGRAQAFERLARGGVDVLSALRVAGLETSGVIVSEEIEEDPDIEEEPETEGVGDGPGL